jgi:hypothetical protein
MAVVIIQVLVSTFTVSSEFQKCIWNAPKKSGHLAMAYLNSGLHNTPSLSTSTSSSSLSTIFFLSPSVSLFSSVR